jgi:hypothetical protein
MPSSLPSELQSQPAGIEIPLRDRGNFIAEAPLLYLPVCGRF